MSEEDTLSFAARARQMEAVEIGFWLMTQLRKAEDQGVEKTELKYRELMQLQCIDFHSRMKEQTDNFRFEVRVVFYLDQSIKVVTDRKCQSLHAAADLARAKNKEAYFKSCLRTVGLRYVSLVSIWRINRVMLLVLF